jgi:LAGLIDADG endonuclease
MIQSFFGGIGTITINPNKRSARYSVVGINDINNFIITHFENYPLQSVKK